jgi:hypothetical protein
MAFIPLGQSGPDAGKLTLEATGAGAQVVLILEGWVSASGTGNGQVFTPLPSTRLVDSTTGSGPCDTTCTRLGPGDAMTVQVAGQAGVPPSATAVMVHVTTKDPGGIGLWFVGASGGNAAVVGDNADGLTSTETVVTPVGANGKIVVGDLFIGSTDIQLDVVGWFTP